jgi:hypothetical protein
VDFAQPFRTCWKFSPGGTKPNESPSSDSSATYVDPDLVKKTVGEGTEENTAVGEGTEETTDPNANTKTLGEGTEETTAVGEGTEDTTDPNANTLEDPTSDISDPLRASGDNSTEDVLSDSEVVKEHTITLVEEIKTDASTEGMIPHNERNSDAITSNPPKGPIGGDGNDESTPQDGSSNTASEEWATILDKRIERKNKKARKNKEKQQKKQAKQLRRQAKHGPAWAQQGGILPSSSDSANGSPRRSSSDSNQNSQLQEIQGDGSNSNGSPDDQGERSNSESRADPQPDPNLSRGSQGATI